MTEWRDIADLKDGEMVIGVMRWPGNDDCGVICGVKYDLRPDCVVDRQRGRWMECTHWAPLPHNGIEP